MRGWQIKNHLTQSGTTQIDFGGTERPQAKTCDGEDSEQNHLPAAGRALNGMGPMKSSAQGELESNRSHPSPALPTR